MTAGTISALQAQALDTQRVNVFVDGVFAIGISLATLAAERLYVGQALSESDYQRLAQSEQIDRAVQVALRAIESRPRSVAETRLRLSRKGYSEDVIDTAIDRLQRLDLLNDASFARFWVEQRQRSRPLGRGALQYELRRKGIDQAVIAETVADHELVGDSIKQAEQLARRAAPKYLRASDYQAFSRRMSAFLQRRGYEFGTIRPIVVKLWEEHTRMPAEE